MVTAEEFQTWLEYRRKHGTLSPLRRLDGNLAQLAALVATAAGLKKKNGAQFEASDFMQWGERDPEPELTADEFFRLMQSTAKGKR